MASRTGLKWKVQQMRTRRPALLIAAFAAALAGCAGAPAATPTGSTMSSAPQAISLRNCGQDVRVVAPPKRAVTLNQGATEVMLALGLEDQMAGTAYLDDAIPQKWKAAYDKVKVLSEEYPTTETFLAAKPDFAYASYASALDSKEGVGTRPELLKDGVTTYLSPFGCPEGVEKAPATMESAWGEATDVARIFGVPERGTKLVTEQRAALEAIRSKRAGAGRTVLWFDSGDKAPFVGAGEGGPQVILDAVGAQNIFADLKGGWTDASWERVVSADPDVIVLPDASWSSTEAKINRLTSDPVLSKLTAVRERRFVTLPFSETTPGVRLVDGAQAVSEQLAKR